MDNIQMWRKLNFLVLVFLFNCVFNNGDIDKHVILANSVYAWNGSCAILPCTITSYATIDYYMWYFNSEYNSETQDFTGTIIHQSNIRSQSKNVVHIGKTAKDCTIVITDLQKKDTGYYRLRLIGKLGKLEDFRWMSKSNLSLSVSHAGPSLKIQTVPEMKENTQVTLSCSIDYYCPFYDMSLTWLQDLNGDVKMYTKNDTSGISVSTTLTFLPSWKDHSKNVSCVLHRTNEETDSRTIQLDVKYAPRNVKVVVKPDTKQLKEGTEVTFECIVNSSNPEVTYIAWYQNNKFVVTFSKKKSILAKDAGTYMCEASNEIGRSSSNKVSVEVLYPPKNSKCTIVNSNQKKEGEQVTFQCQSQQSNPVISSYEWFKGENLYKTTNSDFLKLINLQWNDAGTYSCKAINTIGSSKGECRGLYINYSPKNVTIKVSPGNSVTENTKVQLNCTANAPTLEKLTYSWYHNDQPLLKYQKEYALESIQMDHAGEYYCVVYNDVGSSKSQVLSLHVLYSSSTIGMYAASGIVSLIILMIFVALIIRFGSRLKTCRNTESSDLSFFVLKKPRSELSDQLDQHASSEDSLERINYASLQFPASINGRQSQSRAKANHPDPDPNDIYSVLKKPKSTLEYENIGSSKKTQDESQDEIHYAIIPNLNRGTTVRERGPETEYAMLKKC
ncbi:B-cell receptor CD22 isoform X2 [Ranitomeya imitator]|uniref:B-cell receptor CD22 isoform X2 n=1 Tax=Ranitomeya imitator TaxID=111125 RepID=UPI0037E86E2C